MTRAEAETEALRRWPNTGVVFDREKNYGSVKNPGTSPRFWVGSSARGTVYPHVCGNGNTWEEAFANALGEEFEPTKLTPKEAFDKLNRAASYLHQENRYLVSYALPTTPRPVDVIRGAQNIIRIELSMRGEDGSVLDA